MASGFLRNMPSPEQGASTRIRSKRFCSFEKADGSLFVTTLFATPHFAIFSARVAALDEITSLLTSSPLSFIRSARWVDLPPGAAHKSKTLFGACGEELAAEVP